MSDAVASRMRKAGLAGRTVSIKVRYGDFRTLTRSHTVAAPVSDGQAVASIASGLLDGVDLEEGIRLLGVGVSALRGGTGGEAQLSLDLGADDDRGSWREATEAVDAVRQRFGEAAVGPAALVGPTGVRVKRQGDTQWGPSVG